MPLKGVPAGDALDYAWGSFWSSPGAGPRGCPRGAWSCGRGPRAIFLTRLRRSRTLRLLALRLGGTRCSGPPRSLPVHRGLRGTTGKEPFPSRKERSEACSPGLKTRSGASPSSELCPKASLVSGVCFPKRCRRRTFYSPTATVSACSRACVASPARYSTRTLKTMQRSIWLKLDVQASMSKTVKAASPVSSPAVQS